MRYYDITILDYDISYLYTKIVQYKTRILVSMIPSYFNCDD